MVDQRIRAGDAVSLRSGGPVMTVQALSLSLAYCAWTAEGRFHHGTFEVDSLKQVQRPDSQPQPRDRDDQGSHPES